MLLQLELLLPSRVTLETGLVVLLFDIRCCCCCCGSNLLLLLLLLFVAFDGMGIGSADAAAFPELTEAMAV